MQESKHTTSQLSSSESVNLEDATRFYLDSEDRAVATLCGWRRTMPNWDGYREEIAAQRETAERLRDCWNACAGLDPSAVGNMLAVCEATAASLQIMAMPVKDGSVATNEEIAKIALDGLQFAIAAVKAS